MSIAQEKLMIYVDFRCLIPVSSIFSLYGNYYIQHTQYRWGRCTEQLLNGTCTLALPPECRQDNINFNRSWAVTDYYYNGGALTTTPSGDIVQKQVTVTVIWTDTDGTPQTANLGTVINNISGAASTGALANNVGGSGGSQSLIIHPVWILGLCCECRC